MKASWNPFVSANAGAVPVESSVLAVDVAIAESAAMPSAPPICCVVLNSPDASPASQAALCERRNRNRHEREAEPDRNHQEPGQQVSPVRAADRDLCGVHEARCQRRHPDDEHRLDADPIHELRRDARPHDRRSGDRR